MKKDELDKRQLNEQSEKRNRLSRGRGGDGRMTSDPGLFAFLQGHSTIGPREEREGQRNNQRKKNESNGERV